MTEVSRRLLLAIAVGLTTTPARAEKNYGPGVSDGEIKIGQTMPYSGPASAYGTAGRVAQAYFAMINDHGGVNGRKIRLISLDDGYSPPKTIEQVRKLVEEENVLLIYNPLGTASNSAIQKYLNRKQVPQLFLSSGSSRFNDPQNFPWTMGWLPNYVVEGRTAVTFLTKGRPNAKIAVLYQNDDLGKDYLRGIHDGLGDKARSMIVAQSSYEVTDATIDSQVISLRASGADIFLNVSTAKFAAQAIRKVHDLGWKPQHYVISLSSSIGSVLRPAGFDRAAGIISGAILRDPADPDTMKGAAYADYVAFLRKYYPEGDPTDISNVTGYSVAQTFVQVLKQAGDNLTRANVMREAANLRDFAPPMLLPGLTINTGPADYQPLKSIRLVRFENEHWSLIDE
ncbi:MAG TPA: ABC transporter substrate-binding protein [Vineibacter sp.]|nr:ABC transporter substrate-binding protein [Vineibacter sp.]